MLTKFGIEPQRFRWEWVSAAEDAKWARLVNEMTEQVCALGPLNWKGIAADGVPKEEPRIARRVEMALA